MAILLSESSHRCIPSSVADPIHFSGSGSADPVFKIFELQGLFVDKGSGIFPDPDLGDPDSQHIIIKNMLIPVHPVLKSCAIFRLLKQF